MVTVFVVANSILILTLTVLFVRESNRRRGLELVLRQSIELWRKLYEANLDGRNLDSGLSGNRRMQD